MHRSGGKPPRVSPTFAFVAMGLEAAGGGRRATGAQALWRCQWLRISAD